MRRALLASVAISALGLAAPCGAQTGSASPTPAGQVEEVVVTAQKRSEKLQDVPIAITAVTANAIRASGVTSSVDLNKLVPSFTYTQVQGFSSPFVRGVGTTNITAGDEPSVATYIDGVYQGSTLTSALPYNNVDRIEVLKGPQGTLYGRNAAGGLINIITRTPDQTTILKGSFSYSSYETSEGDAYVSGPIAPTVAADLSVHVRSQDRGYTLNEFNGHRVGVDDFTAFRSRWRFNISSRTTLDLTGDFTTSFDTTSVGATIFPGTVPLLGTTYFTPGPNNTLVAHPGGLFSTQPYHQFNPEDPYFRTTSYGGSAILRTDLGFANLTSITGYRHTQQEIRTDSTDTPVDGVLAVVSLDPKVGVVAPASLSYDSVEHDPYFFTQELQLASKPQGPLTWIVGGFYQDSKETYAPLGVGFVVGQAFAVIQASQSTEAEAVFGQTTYRFDNGISITGGLRYGSERKTMNGSELIAGNLAATTHKSKTFDSVTYRAAIEDRLSDQLMIYASANRGFKSGLFVANVIDNSKAVDPEQLDAYEVGFKSNPNRAIQLNGEFYYYDYSNLQQVLYNSQGLSTLQNVPKARLYGGELELQAIPAPRLTVRASIGLEHSEYVDFPNAAAYANSPDGGEEQVELNVKGRQMTRAPDFTGALSADYRVPLGELGDLDIAGNLYHTSSFPWSASNNFVQKAYTTLDLTGTWTAPDGRWHVSIWGRNLTSALYTTSVVENARSVELAYAPPATAGVTLGFKY
jgi:iron complex outermembrane receptor protein